MSEPKATKKKTTKKKATKKPKAKVNVVTAYYEATHGAAPKPKQKGPYTFQPPRGRNSWRFEGEYSKVCDLLAEMAFTNVGDGDYILLP